MSSFYHCKFTEKRDLEGNNTKTYVTVLNIHGTVKSVVITQQLSACTLHMN